MLILLRYAEPANDLDAHEILKHFECSWIECVVPVPSPANRATSGTELMDFLGVN